MITKTISKLYAEFEAKIMMRMQYVIYIRRSTLTQQQMAYNIGVSLKTIQRFENYKLIDPFLCFAYEKILTQK